MTQMTDALATAEGDMIYRPTCMTALEQPDILFDSPTRIHTPLHITAQQLISVTLRWAKATPGNIGSHPFIKTRQTLVSASVSHHVTVTKQVTTFLHPWTRRPEGARRECLRTNHHTGKYTSTHGEIIAVGHFSFHGTLHYIGTISLFILSQITCKQL